MIHGTVAGMAAGTTHGTTEVYTILGITTITGDTTEDGTPEIAGEEMYITAREKVIPLITIWETGTDLRMAVSMGATPLWEALPEDLK